MTWQQWRDWYRVRPGYWFKPKLYGWGAVPVTWQGWALTAAALLVAGLIAKLAEGRSPLYQLLFIPLFAGFVWVCWVKTDGGWHWHWGRDDR